VAPDYLASTEFETTVAGAALSSVARSSSIPAWPWHTWDAGPAVMDEHFRGTRGGIVELQGAQKDFLTALKLDPGMTRAQRALVQLDWEFGRTEDMLRLAAAAAKKGDSDVEALLVRGLACMINRPQATCRTAIRAVCSSSILRTRTARVLPGRRTLLG
jgi:hypothetical protein